MNIMITGCNGFVGSFLCDYFIKNHHITAHSRNTIHSKSNNNIKYIAYDLNKDLNDLNLQGIETIIHCAGQAHVMNNDAETILKTYKKSNVENTINLAKKSQNDGVKRFIYLSSIKVNGETTQGIPFEPTDPNQLKPFITDPYGISKCEAEIELLKLVQKSNLEIVIIRPVLIYGPNVKASFNSMIKLANSKYPLPVGSLDNKRSMISLYNLASLIEVTLTHPAAKNEIFLAADNEILSVYETFQYLADAQNNRLITLSIPKSILNFLGRITKKQSITDRLTSELIVNTTKNKELLGWDAPLSAKESFYKIFQTDSTSSISASNERT